MESEQPFDAAVATHLRPQFGPVREALMAVRRRGVAGIHRVPPNELAPLAAISEALGNKPDDVEAIRELIETAFASIPASNRYRESIEIWWAIDRKYAGVSETERKRLAVDKAKIGIRATRKNCDEIFTRAVLDLAIPPPPPPDPRPTPEDQADGLRHANRGTPANTVAGSGHRWRTRLLGQTPRGRAIRAVLVIVAILMPCAIFIPLLSNRSEPVASDTPTREFVGPFGNAVNSAPPPFKVSVRMKPRPGHAGQSILESVLLTASSPLQATRLWNHGGGVQVSCTACSELGFGSNRIPVLVSDDNPVRVGSTSIELNGPHAIIKTQTALAIFECGCIGLSRYALVTLDPRTGMVGQTVFGCLAAGYQNVPYATVWTPASVKMLPRVSCNPRPIEGSLRISAPLEEPASTDVSVARTAVSVSGYVKGHAWLSLTTAAATYGQNDESCDTTPGSTQISWGPPGPPGFRLSPVPAPLVVRVSGRFRKTIDVPDADAPEAGFYCAYLQTGKRWRGIPDGPVAASVQAEWRVGDRVVISAPSVVRRHTQSTYVASGYAAQSVSTSDHTTAYVFVSYQRCKASAQAEYAAGYWYTYFAADGSFREKLTLPRLSKPATLCAYLQTGKPTVSVSLSRAIPSGSFIVRTAGHVRVAS